MDTSYDKEFKSIHHFQLHPELLPYVGDNYNGTRILLIGNSFCLPISEFSTELGNTNKDVVEEMFRNWYVDSIPKGINPTSWKNVTESFNTCKVISAFLNEDMSNEIILQAHDLFTWIARLLGKRYNKTYGFFKDFAFFNYYQRPELKERVSGSQEFTDICNIGISEDEVAFETAKNIIRILSPRLTLVVTEQVCRSFDNHYKCLPNRIKLLVNPRFSWIDEERFSAAISGKY